MEHLNEHTSLQHEGIVHGGIMHQEPQRPGNAGTGGPCDGFPRIEVHIYRDTVRVNDFLSKSFEESCLHHPSANAISDSSRRGGGWRGTNPRTRAHEEIDAVIISLYGNAGMFVGC